MGQAWRIVKAAHAAAAMDGEGARRYGGRWNSPGTRIIYSSGTQALAVLESLVHLNPPVAFQFVVIPVGFDPALVETVALPDLPEGWNREPPQACTQHLGDRWVAEARSAVLGVPSALIPSEANYLLNPAHPNFKKIRVGKPITFSFNSRLLP